MDQCVFPGRTTLISTLIDPISKHKTDRAATTDRRLQPPAAPAHSQRQPSSVTLCVVDSKYEVIKEAGRCVYVFGLHFGVQRRPHTRSHGQSILALDRTLGMRLVEADDDRCNIYW